MPSLQWLGKDVGVVSAFFSPEECRACIDLSEDVGFEMAPVATERGTVIMEDLRNNDRVMLDDFERAAEIWQRIAAFAPKRVDRQWHPVGVNERLSLLSLRRQPAVRLARRRLFRARQRRA